MDAQTGPMRRINLTIALLEAARDGHQQRSRLTAAAIRLLRDELRGDVIPRDGADALSLVSQFPESDPPSPRA